MAENPSNGHAPDGQQTNGSPQSVMPRVAAPEGVRSARAFDGSPLQLEETPAFDEALENDEPPTDYRSDFTENFAGATRDDQSVAPLGISIEKSESETQDSTHGFEAFAPENFDLDEAAANADLYSSDDAAPDAATPTSIDVIGADVIEGEQLFADDGAGGDNGGDPPSNDNYALAAGGGNGRPDTPRDQEAGLFEHLTELRSRLIYSIIGVMAIMCFTWHYALPIQGWFSAPITRVLHANGGKGELISTDPTAFFTLQFQSSLLAALLLAAPWVLFQVWRFVEPALTNSERRYTLVLVPFSSVLFFMGATLGYFCSPLFFQFFLQFQPPGVAAQWKYDDSVILMAKMLLIFGLSFQVPIIIIFLNKIGLVTRNLLIEYWRHAVVVIFIVVAVLTPTWDPFTMTACSVPPCLLYLLSIWLVKWL